MSEYDEQVDIIPIILGATIPKKENWCHIQYKSNEYTLEMLIDRIKNDMGVYFRAGFNYGHYDNLILFKKGKVIAVV